MLRRMCGHTQKDQLRKVIVKKKVGLHREQDEEELTTMVWTCKTETN